jgi:CRISPR-associated protein Cas2
LEWSYDRVSEGRLLHETSYPRKKKEIELEGCLVDNYDHKNHIKIMYIIAMYDISTINPESQKRLPQILKLFRQYLHHSQKSVFEGELSLSKYKELKYKASKIIDETADYVLFFSVPNKNNISRDSIGIAFDATTNFIE